MDILPPGTRIGQYEIASQPMMGGMGVVYFALDHGNDGRPVAIKTFRPELLPNREARDRFLREGTAWIELGSHPHIVRCYKVEYIDPTAFLVLELIAKEQNMPDASLRSWLIPGRLLPIEQALLFALQIARGMQYATEKIPGFVHRDLKPENILVGVDRLPGTYNNRLRVTDFGLVKTIVGDVMQGKAGNEDQLAPNQVQFTRGAGTPLYMAPEQWKGEPVGIFTDVYAFGCILFEMLCGQYAAVGTKISELRTSHCDGRLQLITTNPPKEIEPILTKCLMLNPNNRYRFWSDVTHDLEQILVEIRGSSIPQSLLSSDKDNLDEIQTSSSYIALGVAYKDLGQSREATGYFEKSLSIMQRNNNQFGEAIALTNLGLVYSDLGENLQAVDYFNRALIIHRNLNNQFGESAALRNLGLVYADFGDAHRAIRCYKDASNISTKIDDLEGQIASLGNLGTVYSMLGDQQRAITFLDQQLKLSRQHVLPRSEKDALMGIGIVYGDLGDLTKSISYYQLALTICQRIGDRRGESDCLGNLGNAYLRSGKFEKAIIFHEQALAIDRETGNRLGEANALGNLGIVYMEIGDIQRGIKNYELALEIDRSIGNRRGEGADLGDLANAYADLGEVKKAISCYEQALSIRREIRDINGVANDSFNLALLIYKQLNDPDKALPLAQDAYRIYAQTGNPNATMSHHFVFELRGQRPGFFQRLFGNKG